MIEWISVKDDLPDEMEEVLVWSNGKLAMGRRIINEWSVAGEMSLFWFSDNVTHWSRVNAPKKKRQANRGRKA